MDPKNRSPGCEQDIFQLIIYRRSQYRDYTVSGLNIKEIVYEGLEQIQPTLVIPVVGSFQHSNASSSYIWGWGGFF
jgi:hypothetical protein